MANAQGTQRTVVFAKETVFGTKPTKSGAKVLPRVETTLNTQFESYQSEEIRADMQRSASVIGFEKVEGDDRSRALHICTDYCDERSRV